MAGKFGELNGPSIFADGTNNTGSLSNDNGMPSFAEDKLAKGQQAFLQGDYPAALQDFKNISDVIPRANYFLGLMYQENLGTKINLEEVKAYWQKGQEAGDKLCEICLLEEDDFDECYYDADEAKDSLQTELKDSFFAFQFAKLCNKYDSDILDPDEKLRYFQKSAEEGNALAYYALYEIYCKDNKHEKAVENLEKAADKNYPKALITVGGFYEKGVEGYPQDFDKAENFYIRAKEQKYSTANKYLGELYYRKKEYGSAFVYIKRAAKSGDTDCMEKLAYMYENGLGTKQRPEDAKEWYDKLSMLAHKSPDRSLQPKASDITQQPYLASTSSTEQALPSANMPEAAEVPQAEDEFCSRHIQQLFYKLQNNYAPQIDELYLSGVKQRDAAKKVVAVVTKGKAIAGWKFCPVETRLIAAANNSYAGKNLPFDVLAIFDDAAISVPVFTGKSGIMLTSTKFICSQHLAVTLADIENVAIAGNELSIGCKNNKKYVFRANRFFEQAELIEELLLALVYTAKKYRG